MLGQWRFLSTVDRVALEYDGKEDANKPPRYLEPNQPRKTLERWHQEDPPVQQQNGELYH